MVVVIVITVVSEYSSQGGGTGTGIGGTLATDPIHSIYGGHPNLLALTVTTPFRAAIL